MKGKAIVMGTLLAAAVCSAQLEEPRDMSFKSTVDRTDQFYMEMLPKPFNKGVSHDLIIGLHGHGSDRKQFATHPRAECEAFREFAGKHGMIAVTPDYRAATSWMGPQAEEDVVQLIKELKKKHKIDRVFMIGASMGGSSALTFAVLHPDLVDGITAMNGLANHVDYTMFQPEITKSFTSEGGSVVKEKRKRSAEFYPEKLTMPVAMTIGGKDTAVPGESALRLAEKLKGLKRKVHVIYQPEGGHGTTLKDAMEAMEFMRSNARPKKGL